MTDSDKQQILALREEGKSYNVIADTLNISVGTVKAFISRAKSKAAKGTCKYCGKPVNQLPHRKEKKFCSKACRMAWWKQNRQQLNYKAYHQRVCPVCNKEFQVYSTSPKTYCSHACYIKARFGGHDEE